MSRLLRRLEGVEWKREEIAPQGKFHCMEPERKASTQELCLDLILLETSFSRF